MTYRPLIAMIAAALSATACAYRPNPIPLRATADDLTTLQGEWTGTYESTVAGRNGSITFRLDAGADIAYGEVQMTPTGSMNSVQRNFNAAGTGRETNYAVPEILTIAFARIDADRISGKLDSYRDPACGCTVVTTFVGRLRSPTHMEGTFLTEPSSVRSPQSGAWRVTRIKR